MRITKNMPLLFIFKSIVSLYILIIFLSHTVIALETMDTDEITPGMKGYGRTVFSGNQIETFDVESGRARGKMIIEGNIASNIQYNNLQKSILL